MKTFFTLIAVLAISIQVSCGASQQIKGSGNIKKEERTVQAFTKIEVSTAIQIVLTQGNGNPSIVVEADDNLLPYIRTKVSEDKLVVDVSGHGFSATEAIVVHITVAHITDIEANSASKVSSTSRWRENRMELDINSAASLDMNIDVTELEIDLSSAGKINLSGKCDKLNAEVSSAADLNAEELNTKTADIEVSSAAKARINVSGSLSYDVSSAGRLDYSGNPEIMKSITDKVSHVGKN